MAQKSEGTSTSRSTLPADTHRPATQQQKDRIAELAEHGGEPIDPLGWPSTFSESDADAMIGALESALAERGEARG